MSAASRVTCETFLAILDDYIAERLSNEERSEFDRHLAACRSCRAYLASYRATIAMARDTGIGPSLDLADVPAELVAAVLKLIPK